uniref:Ig-like domain-containing protein n=1 Tax=Cyprinus carpio TaxID=7962 RepID=A0A8C2JFQ9_CYPCA
MFFLMKKKSDEKFSEKEIYIYAFNRRFYSKRLTIPEFFAVTTLDGRQIDYYDSEIKKLIPRQDWMIRVQQIYKNNIHVLIQRFNQSHGVHTYQRMYGCGWDDETGASEGFDQYGYDGEDYVALDVKQLRYITPVQQGVITTNKWNNNRAQLELLRQYYQHECVNWLQHFLPLRKVDLERRAPEVSLLQKYPLSPVECHATSFYPSEVTFIWLKNGQEHHEDLDFGELLPNEDGTFQKTYTIIIGPDEWEKNQFVCVVEHKGRTFRKILTEDEIKSNNSNCINLTTLLRQWVSLKLPHMPYIGHNHLDRELTITCSPRHQSLQSRARNLIVNSNIFS